MKCIYTDRVCEVRKFLETCKTHFDLNIYLLAEDTSANRTSTVMAVRNEGRGKVEAGVFPL